MVMKFRGELKECQACKKMKPKNHCFDGNVPYCMDCAWRYSLEDCAFEEQLRLEPDDFQVYNNNEGYGY